MPVPLKERWFEDYVAGETFEFGDHLVSEEEIIEFARRYDPQPFHVDAAAAKASHFGGLIASGWMTGAVMMRMMVDHFIAPASGLGSPGVDQLRWPRPVRPGDQLRARVSVLETRRSQSKPDRGAVFVRQEMINQAGDVVMSVEGRALVRCRSDAPGEVQRGAGRAPGRSQAGPRQPRDAAGAPSVQADAGRLGAAPLAPLGGSADVSPSDEGHR